MRYSKVGKYILFFLISIFFWCGCRNSPEKVESDIVTKPEKMPERIRNDLEITLDDILKSGGKLNDSVTVGYSKLEDSLYSSRNYSSIWNEHERWLPLADSLYKFIQNAKEFGLFPEDYHYNMLSFIRRVLVEDSVAKKNAVMWARADVLFTDAFFKLIKDLKQGRLPVDSVTLRNDGKIKDSVFTTTLDEAFRSRDIDSTMAELEPKIRGYDSIRAYLK